MVTQTLEKKESHGCKNSLFFKTGVIIYELITTIFSKNVYETHAEVKLQIPFSQSQNVKRNFLPMLFLGYSDYTVTRTL